MSPNDCSAVLFVKCAHALEERKIKCCLNKIWEICKKNDFVPGASSEGSSPDSACFGNENCGNCKHNLIQGDFCWVIFCISEDEMPDGIHDIRVRNAGEETFEIIVVKSEVAEFLGRVLFKKSADL